MFKKIKNFNKFTLTLVLTFALIATMAIAGMGSMLTASAATSDYYNLFDGGNGTESSPFEICDAEQLSNMSQIATSDWATYYYYFKLTDNIYLDDYFTAEETIICNYFHGQFDGAGYNIYAAENVGVYLGLYSVESATFKDVTVYQNGSAGFFTFLCYGGYYGIAGSSVTRDNYTVIFEDITIKSVKATEPLQLGNNSSSFIAHFADGYLVFRNCVNSASLNYISYGGIFLGGYALNAAKVVYDRCVNDGIVTGVKVGFFNGNTPDEARSFKLVATDSITDRTNEVVPGTITEENPEGTCYLSAYVSNCANYGSITGTTTCTPFATNVNTFNAATNAALTSAQLGGNKLTTNEAIGSLSLGLNTAGNVVITGEVESSITESVSYYMVTYYVSINFKDANGNNMGSSYIRVDKRVDNASSWSMTYINKMVGSDKYDLTAETGSTYSELVASGATVYNDTLYNINYIVVGNTMIVDVNSVYEAHKDAFSGATEITIGGNVPTYEIAAYNVGNSVLCSRAIAGGLN